jgi:hypothetical protein
MVLDGKKNCLTVAWTDTTAKGQEEPMRCKGGNELQILQFWLPTALSTGEHVNTDAKPRAFETACVRLSP